MREWKFSLDYDEFQNLKINKDKLILLWRDIVKNYMREMSGNEEEALIANISEVVDIMRQIANKKKHPTGFYSSMLLIMVENELRGLVETAIKNDAMAQLRADLENY